MIKKKTIEKSIKSKVASSQRSNKRDQIVGNLAVVKGTPWGKQQWPHGRHRIMGHCE